jgi:cyclase
MEHSGAVLEKHGIIGVAAGSLFVFKGRFKAVLINYPTPKEKTALIKDRFLANWQSKDAV